MGNTIFTIELQMTFVKPNFINAEKIPYLSGGGGRRTTRSPSLEEVPSSPPKSIRSEVMERNALLLMQNDPEFYPGIFTY